MALALLAVAMGAGLAFKRARNVGRPAATIEYRGKHYRLTRAYADFDEYKNDPGNLAAEEIPRVEAAMTQAPFPRTFSSMKTFLVVVYDVAFPGYGVGFTGRVKDPGTALVVQEVEIPRVDKARVFVARNHGQALTVLDDFILDGDGSAIRDIRVERGTLRYLGKNGRVIRSKRL